jgi:hypothetical protein
MRTGGWRYAGAVGPAALQGLVSAAWVAAEELPAGARRLARLGLSLAVAAIGAATPDRDGDEGPRRPPPPPRAEPPVTPARVAAAALLVPALTVGPVLLRQRLERRWLGQLTRSGHPHPHRVIALRIGLLSMAGTLASDLAKAYRPGVRR